MVVAAAVLPVEAGPVHLLQVVSVAVLEVTMRGGNPLFRWLRTTTTTTIMELMIEVEDLPIRLRLELLRIATKTIILSPIARLEAETAVVEDNAKLEWKKKLLIAKALFSETTTIQEMMLLRLRWSQAFA